MNIEQIKSSIIGKWKTQDDRILEFATGETFTSTSRDRKSTSPPQKIFFKKQENGSISLSMPSMMEHLGIIKSVNNNEIIYDSIESNGSKNEVILTRI